jgi:hypothetical protein
MNFPANPSVNGPYRTSLNWQFIEVEMNGR